MMRDKIRSILIILLLSILVFSSTSIAESDVEKNSLNAAKIATTNLEASFGKGILVPAEQSFGYDIVNSRLIAIGEESLGGDLAVIIRTSVSQVCYWSLPLTKENLEKAYEVLDEDAPFCRVSFRLEGAYKAAMYINTSDTKFPYNSFLTDVEIITNYLFNGLLGTNDTADPVLSIFPGIEWGMTKEEIQNKFGQDTFKYGDPWMIESSQNILGKRTLLFFTFSNERLSEISLFNADKNFLEEIKKIYGQPKKISYEDTYGRIYDEKADGDCNYWSTFDTIILVTDSVDTIKYRPKY